jgi:hypothetical protein
MAVRHDRCSRLIDGARRTSAGRDEQFESSGTGDLAGHVREPRGPT